MPKRGKNFDTNQWKKLVKDLLDNPKTANVVDQSKRLELALSVSPDKTIVKEVNAAISKALQPIEKDFFEGIKSLQAAITSSAKMNPDSLKTILKSLDSIQSFVESSNTNFPTAVVTSAPGVVKTTTRPTESTKVTQEAIKSIKKVIEKAHVEENIDEDLEKEIRNLSKSSSKQIGGSTKKTSDKLQSLEDRLIELLKKSSDSSSAKILKNLTESRKKSEIEALKKNKRLTAEYMSRSEELLSSYSLQLSTLMTDERLSKDKTLDELRSDLHTAIEDMQEGNTDNDFFRQISGKLNDLESSYTLNQKDMDLLLLIQEKTAKTFEKTKKDSDKDLLRSLVKSGDKSSLKLFKDLVNQERKSADTVKREFKDAASLNRAQLNSQLKILEEANVDDPSVTELKEVTLAALSALRKGDIKEFDYIQSKLKDLEGNFGTTENLQTLIEAGNKRVEKRFDLIDRTTYKVLSYSKDKFFGIADSLGIKSINVGNAIRATVGAGKLAYKGVKSAKKFVESRKEIKDLKLEIESGFKAQPALFSKQIEPALEKMSEPVVDGTTTNLPKPVEITKSPKPVELPYGAIKPLSKEIQNRPQIVTRVETTKPTETESVQTTVSKEQTPAISKEQAPIVKKAEPVVKRATTSATDKKSKSLTLDQLKSSFSSGLSKYLPKTSAEKAQTETGKSITEVRGQQDSILFRKQVGLLEKLVKGQSKNKSEDSGGGGLISGLVTSLLGALGLGGLMGGKGGLAGKLGGAIAKYGKGLLGVAARVSLVGGVALASWSVGSALYEKYTLEIADGIDNTVKAFGDTMDWIKKTAGDISTFASDSLKTFKEKRDSIKQYLVNGLSDGMTSLSSSAKGLKDYAVDKTSQGIEAVVDTAKSSVSKAAQMGSAVADRIEPIASSLSSATGQIASDVGSAVSSGVSTVSTMAAAVPSTVSSMAAAVPQAVSSIASTVSSAASSAIDYGKQKFSSLRDAAGKLFRVGSGVTLDGVQPGMQQNFVAMAQEYKDRGGKGNIQINSAFRTPEEQARLYAQDPKKAAPPGKSTHGLGLAIDINSREANELDSMGLLSKYGFSRPVKGEAWHLQAAGTSATASAKGIYSADAPTDQMTPSGNMALSSASSSSETAPGVNTQTTTANSPTAATSTTMRSESLKNVPEDFVPSSNTKPPSSGGQSKAVSPGVASMPSSNSLATVPTFSYNDGGFFAMNAGLFGS